MARRPRTQGRKQQSTLVGPFAVFVALFIISLGFAVYFYVEWRDLRGRIWGSYVRHRDAKYEELKSTEDGYTGYINLLEDSDVKQMALLDENKKLADIIGMNELDALQDRFKELKDSFNAIDKEEGTADTFVEFMRRVVLENQDLNKRIEDADKAKGLLNQQLDETHDQLAAAKELNTETERKWNKEIREKNDELNETRKDHERILTKRERQIGELEDEKEQLRTESKTAIRKLTHELAQARTALEEVQAIKTGAREKEFTLDYAESDGIILNVDAMGKFCSVDIGRRDGAQVGMQFLVCETGPGGRRREKAKIELKEVHPDFSIAGIAEMKDKLNPIMEDDDIISPLFKRGQPHVFVFEDDIDLIDKKRLAAKIERFGNRVSNEVTSSTDFVIIEDNPGKKAAEATRWAVRRIRIRDLNRVLGD